jgi:CheY-like chemotaxis protein
MPVAAKVEYVKILNELRTNEPERNGFPVDSLFPRGRACKVLFVDDSVDLLNLLKIELGDLGYDVLTATDGQAGLQVTYDQHPDIIISDIKMPVMDGYEFVQRLRSSPEIASIPAIAMTSYGTKRDVERAFAVGYNAHLRKPAEMDELSDLIKKLLSA